MNEVEWVGAFVSRLAFSRTLKPKASHPSLFRTFLDSPRENSHRKVPAGNHGIQQNLLVPQTKTISSSRPFSIFLFFCFSTFHSICLVFYFLFFSFHFRTLDFSVARRVRWRLNLRSRCTAAVPYGQRPPLFRVLEFWSFQVFKYWSFGVFDLRL